MPWRCITMLLLVSTLLLGRTPAQQPGHAETPTTAQSTETEISTRTTDTTIKVRVDLVPVRVVVKDASGKVVPDLKREDFQVLDNGKKQKISAFTVEKEETLEESAAAKVKAKQTETSKSAEAEAGTGIASAVMPKRFVALVFDDSHMQAADAVAVRAATEKLFATLTPTDRVAIYSTTGTVQQDFTGDTATLRKTLAAVVPHPTKGEGQYQCPDISYYQADLIVNKNDQEAIMAASVDAQVNDCPTNLRAAAQRVLEAGDLLTQEGYERLGNIVAHLAFMPGQRVLAYVSPGFILPDAVLQKSWEWIEQAVRAGVVVNAIDARGLYNADVMPDISAPPKMAPYKGDSTVDYEGMEGTFRMQAQFDSEQVLAGMAASTGGTYYHNRNDLNVGISQALAAPSVTYVLGFAPQNPKLDGKFHKLKVSVAGGKKFRVQARNGYFSSKTPVGDPEEVAKQAVREALLSQDEMVAIPVKLEAGSVEVDAKSERLTVVTNLDVRGIRFRKANGLSSNDLVLATGLFDSNGHMVNGEMKEVALKLKDSTVEEMNKTGFTVKNEFTVKPGTYRVRSVVRGSEDEQLTARNLVTVIPAKPANETARQPVEISKQAFGAELQWAPPAVDAHLKSISLAPPCNLSGVLHHAAANALSLASNLEKFTAQEHIAYVTLDRAGMVTEYDSGSFEYVYSMERQKNGAVSREYRTPLKGSHAFSAAGLDIGQVAIALIFHPELQTDYEMQCEGVDARNGQLDWVVHFQQRKDKPSRTARFSVDNASYPGDLKGRAWISNENFQVVHLEGTLMHDVPAIGLQGLAFSVDYGPAQSATGDSGPWLPNHSVTYWNFDTNRIILAHTLADFQFFSVETKEKIEPTKRP